MAPAKTTVQKTSIFLKILAITFFSETLVMLVLPHILSDETNSLFTAVADSTFLTILLSPFLWRFVVRPIRITAEKDIGAAEELVYQSERDWENVFNTITDMITVHDKEFNIIRDNKAAEKILNLPRLEAARAKCFEHYHGTERPFENCPSCQSLVTGKPTVSELFEPHLNMFIEIRAIPRVDANNNIIGLIHVVRDITDRKRMEDSVREQKAFVESVIQNSAVATFVLDPQHRIMLWNKACEELTGVSSERMIGTDAHWSPFYDHKRPTLADLVIKGNGRRLASHYSKFSHSMLIKNGLQAEGWYRNLNGKDRYILFDAVPIYNSKGELAVAIETLQDITALRSIEEDLARSEERLRTIIETVPECVKLLAADGTLLEMNSSGLAMIEADTHEQVAGKSLYPAIVQEHRAAFQALNNKVFQGGSGSLEFEIIGLRGTRRWVETRAVPLKDANGDITAALGVTRDITEQKKLEAQLRHAQKMEAIGTLTGGIAHDFNNILTAIIGYGSILKLKTGQDDPARTLVEQILASTERATSLTQSLLAFSRKAVITLRPINLNDTVKRVEKLLRRLIGENIVLKSVLTDKDATIVADSGQIEQVLMNLATNARDAMPDGGILTIATGIAHLGNDFINIHGFGKPGVYAVITIADTGAGMDDKTRERIFEPFFTTKEVGKGTGLGLSIVYGIIKQHNGYVLCSSAPGRGTTFTLYLPLARAAVREQDAQEPLVPKGGTETILVAEDDPEVRKLTSAFLKEFGYTIVEAQDGEDAVRQFMAEQDVVDLLLFDVMMPKKDGMKAYHEIRKTKPGVRALFMSGYDMNAVVEKGVAEKDFEFMFKPVSPETLLTKVREVLDR